MENLTLEGLPRAFVQLYKEVGEIKQLLIEQGVSTKGDSICWFSLQELCNYLPDKPAKATVYGWVHENLIPFHKGGKKLRFLKSEIDDWLKQGKRKTIAEIASEADKILKKKGGTSQ